MLRYIALIILACMLSAPSKNKAKVLDKELLHKLQLLNPRLDLPTSLIVVNALSKYSRLYGTNPEVSLAVAMQESGLENINRYAEGLVPVLNQKTGLTHLVPGQVITDIGMFQFHIRTAAALGLDTTRLLWDLDYAVHEHVKLLSQKQKMCQGRKWPWACYHSLTTAQYLTYAKSVTQYLNWIRTKE